MLVALINALLLPPLNLVLACALGLKLLHKYPRVGRSISAAALMLLVVLSTQAGALLFVKPLERLGVPTVCPANAGAQAIVVLGSAGTDELYRTRYAARLQSKTGLPLLVTGGGPFMIGNLRDDYGKPITWIEDHATDTEENAKFSAPILREAGVQRILLVTDAVHMARSKLIFGDNNLDVIPAPAQFHGLNALQLSSFLPDGEGLRLSRYAMREWIGIAWYLLRR